MTIRPYLPVLLLALLPALMAADAPPPRFPNVLVVTIDTLRADRLSGYGYGRPTSPHMDELMADGVRFSEARCVEPLTGPSLASMLTSLAPHEHGATRNGMAVKQDLPSLPKVLRKRGFETVALVSNWTLRDRLSGLGEHFENYQEVFTRKRWFGLMNSEATGEDVSETAIAWLERHAGVEPRRPFFAWVHYVEPHAPYRFHPELAPALGLADSRDPSRQDRYDTEVAFVDRTVGRLLQRARALFPREQLLIVLTSDHGENLGEHGYWGHGRHVWEENLRIPLAVTWSGRLAPGVVSALASNLDLAPTLLGLLGLPIPASFQGFDWSPVLRREAPEPEGRTTYHQAHKGAVIPGQDSERVRRHGLLEVALVQGTSKEVLRVKTDDHSHRLFDLVKDPGERRNLVKQRSKPSPLLMAWLQRVQEGLELADQEPPPSLDAESLEQLRSLGYLE